jgi:hypothetical protein
MNLQMLRLPLPLFLALFPIPPILQDVKRIGFSFLTAPVARGRSGNATVSPFSYEPSSRLVTSAVSGFRII